MNNLVMLINWVLASDEGNPFIPKDSGPFGNASEMAFVFVGVVLLFVIGYGVAKMIWGED